MSTVNCETKSKWRISRGECLLMAEYSTHTSGLCSTNGRPECANFLCLSNVPDSEVGSEQLHAKRAAGRLCRLQLLIKEC